MKRTIVLIRHGKSSWGNPLISDFERPLNERGERDAPAMGEKLKNLKIMPDLIVSSTAKRTKQTAKKIAEAIGYDKDKIKWEEKLYHCIPSVFEEVINEVGDDVNTLILVGHNPGITEFVNELSPDFSIDNLPTCGVVAAHVDLTDWNRFSESERKVFLFEHPEK